MKNGLDYWWKKFKDLEASVKREANKEKNENEILRLVWLLQNTKTGDIKEQKKLRGEIVDLRSNM